MRPSTSPFPILFIFLLACGSTDQKNESPVDRDHCPEVHHKGSMHAIKMEKDLSGKKALDSWEDRRGIYGLGPLEGLDGEVLIWNGKPWVSTETNGKTDLEQKAEASAAFLVWSKVDRWDSTELASFSSLEELEKGIADKTQGDPCEEKAFPFLLKGRVDSLSWHIVNWDEGSGKEHSHKSHRRSGAHGTIEDQQVNILGFWSTEHRGVFIHHSARTHLHFISSNKDLMGHVDGLSNTHGSLNLYLPQGNKSSKIRD